MGAAGMQAIAISPRREGEMACNGTMCRLRRSPDRPATVAGAGRCRYCLVKMTFPEEPLAHFPERVKL